MEQVARWVEVVLDVEQLERPLCYHVPSRLADRIDRGTPVQVPLGRRVVRGYVVRQVDSPPPEKEIKDILRVEERIPPLGEDLLELMVWMQRRYLCSPGAALQTMVPRLLQSGAKKTRRLVQLAIPVEKAREMAAGLVSRAPRQAHLLLLLCEQGQLPVTELDIKDRRGLAALAGKGWVTLTTQELFRQSYVGLAAAGGEVSLNLEQRRAVDQLTRAVGQGWFQPFLLYGVTASGKTEVYLRLIAETIRRGRQCLFLVPEIFLVPQVLGELRARFGYEKVAVWHSSLSRGERYDAWWQIAKGEAPVVIGTRSAAFAPVPRLGLVVMDEEQEPSYKEEHGVRYHTREVILKRAQLTRAVVLLGTATPSLETYYRANSGAYTSLYLHRRVTPHGLPDVKIVDMRAERQDGNYNLFSRYLQGQMAAALRRGEQVVLLINRRGYYPYLLCQECGFVWRCPHCDISLTYHQVAAASLRCHYCGYERAIDWTCPQCGSAQGWRGRGIGTQQVEAEVRRLFPGSPVVRVDRDAATRKEARWQFYDTFRRGKAAVMVGTQMVAQGLDLPGITLVGVVDADTLLNLPDFRGRERTFQLMTQVAGRAGRGAIPGEVVLQTYRPEEESLLAVVSGNTQAFYTAEGDWRRVYFYPPFSHLVRLIFTADHPDFLQESMAWLGEFLRAHPAGQSEVNILGPTPAPVARVKDRYRWQVIIRGKQLKGIYLVVEDLKENFRQRYGRRRGLQVVIDVEPQNML